MSRAWFQQAERGSPLALRIILWVALNLGRRASRALLYPITAYFLLFAPQSRRHSRNYLRRALQREPRLADLARHLHSFAAVILDRVFLLAGQDACLDIRVHNRETFLEHVDSGRGAILLGAHLGSFEALRALAVGKYDFPVRVLMYSDHNQSITQVLEALNPEVAASVIPLGRTETLIQARECLDRGELIATLGDRVAESDKMVACDFLGDTALFPQGPLLLAAVLKVPVILCFGLYRGGNRYDIVFEPFAETLDAPRGQRDEILAQWVQRYADRLAARVREAPYNWFNFYDFWDDASK
ncbi:MULTISPECIES: lipid A biosynthesis acyltransferase [unclassified Thioalkalivibrio]|uniref:LpxL/LpxP family acyltransferase n=1 Tax=unclassified Thioalkalivibrio TaxID=2621013 RepID=UPI000374F1F9|nr:MULTISPECIES: lipid A biosynthesis acyltransferase [unclassified Thioalkalivibrio]